MLEMSSKEMNENFGEIFDPQPSGDYGDAAEDNADDVDADINDRRWWGQWWDICETKNVEISVRRQWWDILWDNDEIFCETKNHAIFLRQKWWDICETMMRYFVRQW